MAVESVLEIVDQGAWNGGTVVDNSVYENTGMLFKGGIPVTNETIQSRIGVKTRIAAPDDERIGVLALRELLDSSGLDFSRTKVIIGATNVGEDKVDPGPHIRHTRDLVDAHCPGALLFDLYAGCPGFNVSVGLLLTLSQAGVLTENDISIIVGAENIHRAKVFAPGHTANIIFGDDAMATALRTTATLAPRGTSSSEEARGLKPGEDLVSSMAAALFQMNGRQRLDGIIIDNQIGDLRLRIPASAARVQHRLTERMYPEEAAAGVFGKFKSALDFYDENVRSFAFDIQSLDHTPDLVNRIARAYVEAGQCARVAAIFVSRAGTFDLFIHSGSGFDLHRPRSGVVDSTTRTHGCFADFIHAASVGGELFGEMDGKGVFLYATRGAAGHLRHLLAANDVTIDDIGLLVEHQANFAIIPATLEHLLDDGRQDLKAAVAHWVADRMVTNIHTRGNTSVVCMQRLPYDLARGALEQDVIQGFTVNRDLERLRLARTVLYDSVGAGMTRSSFLERR